MAKNISIIAFLLISAFISIAQTSGEISMETSIKEVRLYLNGAEVFREANLNLNKGRNQFKFSGLSGKLYTESIKAELSASEVKILSLSSKTNYLRKNKEDQRVKQLRDSVEIVRSDLDILKGEQDAYVEEREFLKANRKFKGDDRTLGTSELRMVADFYRERNFEINKAVAAIDKKIEKTTQRLFDLKLQMSELNARQQPTSDIFLTLDAPMAMATGITLRFVVDDAGWSAIYDLEAGDLSKPIALSYRALAFNNSGIDWNNIKLTLTTVDPLQSATQPSLAVWNLNDYSSSQLSNIAQKLDYGANISFSERNDRLNMLNEKQTQFAQAYQNEAQQILGKDFNPHVDYNTEFNRRYQADKLNKPQRREWEMDIPELSFDFEIEEKFTLPSDKKEYSVDINQFSLEATYRYFAVPKLDKDAFLLARIIGWEELDLVSGPVNIYKGKKYIGQSNLDIRNLSDTLSVSLGRDNNVVIERTKVKNKSRKQILGGLKKVSVAYDISVRNSHSVPIQIELRDQVPISDDKEVVITLDEDGGAELEEKLGLLSWVMTLQASETKTASFGFSVKYPKDQRVTIQYRNVKKVMTPRYF